MKVFYAPFITAAVLAQCIVADNATAGKSTTQSSASTASTSVDSGESLAVVEPVISCSSLLSVDITSIGGSGSNITEAMETEVDGISYCYLEGYLPPQAKWMMRLPISTWTQRYLQAGCGGLCGADQVTLSVVAAEGSTQYENGHFAVATTDMDGGTDGSFALDENALIDFAYLAVHSTAEIAKALIKEYYGQEQAYAYFNGCSDGGREAIMEALRYPEDFNGIVAGAPAFLFQFQNSFHHAWVAHSNLDVNDEPIFNPSRIPILYDAVVAACDALDGVEDGLMSDPRICSFDPRTIQCINDTDNATCLTAAEAQVAYEFYTGPTDEASGEHLTVGELQYGSENAWVGVGIPAVDGGSVASEMIALSALRYLIFEDAPGPNYTLDDFVFANSTIDLLRPHHPLLDAVSPDLSAFREAGGKLILWHGWADQHISPRTTIQYHEKLIDTMGADAVEDFNRFYLFPGVWHCGSGEGMASFDLLTPMLNWIEAGSAPHEIMTSTEGSSASGSSSTVNRTRPAYPYPSVAKYTGSGDMNDAMNWEEGDALYSNLTAYWLGEDFFDVFTPVMEP
ncbi:Mono(2-hydroxyethyl) terephthalate hydrolase [Phytophthora citrophthora]|uniref:feruloyl esterase n=1 Tax=Phytophthora citrophthora TaxID=4793 RepID=A0AAD9GQ74_9STRA|nr:Mono(2-hydroxyethyl) terephthalate hydrolase [Phytophthora citrophthora]